MIGVSSAPPRLSSLPNPPCAPAAFIVGFAHDMLSGSAPEGSVPFERTLAADGSGIAGGKGKTFAEEVTCTTRSRAWR